MQDSVFGHAELEGRVKITKPDGRVFYQNLKMDHEEVYIDQHGNITAVYPENAEVE